MEITKKINSIACGLCLAFSVISGVQANPSGATVVHGSATFSQPNANTLNVTNSPGAIINWQQFGIKQGELTRFIQQGANSAVLNRIIGQDPSVILGQLQSNGKVYLVNPNGVVFGQGSMVNTAGLITSTLNISNQDFINGTKGGTMRFADLQNAAEILNQGFISASNGGEVVFVAPKITNKGTIKVDNGAIVLAAGQSVTINSLNYDNIEFEVQAPQNKVVNLGQMISDGGSIGVFAGSIVNKGIVSANAVTVDAAGNIVFVAQTDTVIENGTLSATSQTGKGGDIKILGERIALIGKTTVDASGKTGGGEVLVGGDLQGKNPQVKNSRQTVISKNVSIAADAKQSGDGGKVIVWADDSTIVHGEISATGGAVSGNGGFVETSGKQNLRITSTPDVTASNGAGGEWLIDPNNITIVAGSGNTGINTVDPFLSTADGATLGVDLITAALTGNVNVTIATGSGGAELGDITLATALELDNTGGTNTLTLSAINDININAAIQDTTPGGQTLNLVLIADSDAAAGGNINIAADINLAGGNLDLNTPNTIAMSTGIVTVAALTTTNAASTFNITGGTLDIASDSTVTADVNLSAGTLTGTGNLILAGAFNWTGGILGGSGLLTTNGNGSIGNAAGLTISRNWNNTGTVNWSTGAINLDTGFAFVNTGTVDANAATTFNVAASSTFSNQNILNINGDTVISGAGTFDNSGAITTSSAMTLFMSTTTGSDTGSWTGAGNYEIAGGVRTLNTGFSLTNTGNLTISNGTLDFNTGGAFSINSAALNLSGGTLTGADSLTITNTFNWSGGLITGTGTLSTTNANLNNATGLILSRDWTSTGTLDWQTGNLSLTGSKTLNNSGTFNANAAASFTIDAGSVFDNQGALNILSNTLIDGGGAFNHAATFAITTSPSITLSIATATGTDAGQWDNSGTIALTGGTRTLNAGFNITNTGTIDLSAGTLDFITGSAFTLAATQTLNLSGGTLTGADALTIAGAFNWSGGNLAGAGQLTTSGTTTISTTAAKNIDRNWDNTGTVNWNAGDLALINSKTFTNNGGFNAAAAASLTVNTGSTFANQSNLTVSSNTTVAGAGAFQQNAGQLLLSNATLTIPTLTLSGGTLAGNGTVSGDVINNGGTVQPGGANVIGTLNITGSYTQGAGGTSVIDILNNTDVAGTGYDLLAVGGQADLLGTLTLLANGGYTVSNNDTFSPITYASNTGNVFTTINAIGGENVIPTYNAGSLSIILNTGAITISWTGAGDGITWNDLANWDIRIPISTDDASIIGAVNVSINANADANTLVLGSSASLTLGSGTFTLANASTLDGSFTLSGGTLNTANAITFNGAFNWNGGALAGGGLLTTGGTTALSNTTGITLTRNWNNTGTVNWAAGDLSIGAGQTLTNTSTGTFNVNTAAAATLTVASTATLDNQNSFNVNSDTLINGAGSFTNSGILTTASTKTLTIATTTGTDSGTWMGAGNFTISGGVRTLNTGFALSNTGNLNLSGGTLDFNTGGPFAVTTVVNLSAGTLTGSDALTLSNAFNWTGGTLSGTGLFTTNAISTLSGSGMTVNRNWNNSDTVNWTAGTLTINGVFTNTVGSFFNANLSATNNIDGSGSFVNAGTFNNNNSATTNILTASISNSGTFNANANTLIGGSLSNSGTITITSGKTFQLDSNGIHNFTAGNVTGPGSFLITGNDSLFINTASTVTIGAALANSGTIDIRAGQLNLTSSYIQTAGSTILSGGGLTVTTLNLNGGTLAGSGTITGNVINTGGTVQPGGVAAIGTLKITGNYKQETGGATVIDILNNVGVAGTGYDLLEITGQADLLGTLTILSTGGYTVRNNDLFVPITYASKTANVFSLPIIPIGGETATPTYNSTNLSLLLTKLEVLFDGGVGGIGTNWDDAINWAGDQIPDPGDNVNLATFSVTLISNRTISELTIGSAGELTLGSNGNLVILANSVIDGAVIISGGTLDVASNSSFQDLTITTAGSTLQGSGNIVVNGALNWIAGSIVGTGLLTTTAATNVAGPIVSRNWNNTGTVTWTSGNFSVASGITLTNTTTGNFNADASSLLNVAGTFDNQGSLNINSNTTLNGNGVFNNSGTINTASNNTLSIATTSGADTGTWAGAGNYEIAGGARTLNSGFNISSTGNLNISSGTLNFNTGNAFTISTAAVNLSGGTLTGNDALTISNLFSWTGGSLTGAGQLTTSGTTNISNASGKNINRNWNNTGTVNWSGGGLTLINSKSFINNGIFNAGAGATLTINNNSSFDNQSRFNVNTNTAISGAGSFLQSAGQLVLNNATLTIPSLAIDGGVLTGNGTIAGNLTNNGGIIQPGGVDTIGTINVTGNFSQNTGSIEIEIKSATPVAAAGEYDKLTISGSGDFIGGSIDLLAVASYGKKSGDRFEPISYGSLPASTTIVNPIGSEILTVSFNPTILNIDIASIGIISWTGLGDGVSWGDLANWSDNITPSIFDDVSIAGGFDISITGGANAGTLALAATSSLTLTGGTFTLASDSTLAGSFTVSGGTFASNGVTTLNGGFNWNGGTITSPGSGQLITNDVTTISTAVHNLNNISWNNNGTVNWNGGNMMLSGATINNQNASTWNIQTASNNDISGAGSFNMLTGSVLNVDSGTTIINSVFTNNSSVNINGGTLTLAEAGNPTDTGAYVISSGALQLDSDRQFTGALNMNGGTLRINANNSFADGVTVKAGTLDVGTSGVLDVSSVATGLVIEANGAARVNGNVTGSVANNGVLSGSGIIVGDVTNAGQLNPGDQIGTFTIDGDLTLLKASQLNIDIAGLEKGTEYDELIVNGAVKFNGNLNIKVDNSTGYNAAVQDSFYPVSYASSSGDVVLSAPPAYAFDLSFETKNLNLVTTIVPGLFIPDTQNEVIVLMDILKNIESIKDKEKEKEDLLHSEENEKGHALMCS